MDSGQYNSVSSVERERRSVVIVTAMGLEARAVTCHLQGLAEKESVSGVVYDCGLFDGERVQWDVAVAECGTGNTAASHIVHDAVIYFDPDVVLFVGVAGGLKDVELGDVVASTKVYCYHAGKAADNFEERPMLEWANTRLEQRARAVCRRESWIGRIECADGLPPEKLRAFVGPIAAGEQVVASENSDTYRFLRKSFGDALSVEMEGYGFLSAARFCSTSALVIRGISDFCDDRKSHQDAEGWQPRAAAHAAAFAFELLFHHQPPANVFHKAMEVPAREAGMQQQTHSPKNREARTKYSIEELKAAIGRPAKNLLSREVEPAAWIPRDVERELQRIVGVDKNRLVCVLGSPGSGKTALLAKFSHECVDHGFATLAIKADLTATGVTFEESLKSQCAVDIPVLDAIAIIANENPVIVIIDQLDALAGLVDLHSDRLNEVLSFIDRCVAIPNVWIVCSCREFEYEHDVRFTVLEPQVVSLQLPAWDQVVVQLEQNGLQNCNEWPESFRDILRTPQHLSVFLQQYQETGNADVSQSYQHMLDDLWTRSINTGDRREFVYKFTESLTRSESLWAPAARFEADGAAIDDLISAHVLTRDGLQIGFRHQTLLEHARARLFAKSDESLCQHVLDRQNAILVRPTIWSVLAYLREADPKKYEQELDGLFSSKLRLHVRYLLLDFLGQQRQPTEGEVLHVASRLNDEEDRGRALAAVQGNEAWFRELKGTQLPAAMQWPAESLWPMVLVLRGAWTFCREDCLSLIERYWLPDTSRDNFTIQALKGLSQWNERAVDIVCRLVSRAEPGRHWWAESLARNVSDDEPDLAPRIVKETLSHSLTRDGDPLDGRNEWHELPTIAEASPIRFLEELWGEFVKIALRFHNQETSPVVNRYHGWTSVLDNRDYARPVMEAFHTALKETALREPQRFVDVVRPSWDTENHLVHSIIAIGFASAPGALATNALEFLCGDPRRMMLGNHEDGEQIYSMRLIEAIAPHLEPHERRQLEEFLLSWSEYRPDYEMEGDQYVWDRQARLRLLRAIPEEFLSSEATAFAKAEEQAVPGWEQHGRGPHQFGLVHEIPPMTKEQMSTADDEAVLDSLRGPYDRGTPLSKWSEEEGRFTCPGGAHAAARELSELAETNPDRVLPILRKLIDEQNEPPVAEVLHKLDKCPISDTEVFSLVAELSANRQPSEEFRSNASYLLYQRCQKKVGLPDEICTILESWLAMPWDAQRSGMADSDDVDSSFLDNPPESIVWHSEGGVIDTDRSFWPLMALTNGFLMRDPAETSQWFDALEAHIPRDISEKTWRWYCRELRWITLRGTDRQRGERIIAALFSQFQALEISGSGIRLVAAVSGALSHQFIEDFLENLWIQQSPRTLQAYAELLTLISLRDEHHDWAKATLEDKIALLSSIPPELSESFRVGVCFVAAQMWDVVSKRSEAVELLEITASHATERMARAFGSVFWAADDFVDDANTRRLLNIVIQNPSMLHDSSILDLSAHLARLCKFQQKTVMQITKTILKRYGKDVGSMSMELYRSAPDLVNIAMTLQRFSETRSQGLTLLEDLMKLGVDEAYKLLSDIDIRPAPVPPPAPTRQRRRRQRRR